MENQPWRERQTTDQPTTEDGMGFSVDQIRFGDKNSAAVCEQVVIYPPGGNYIMDLGEIKCTCDVVHRHRPTPD